MKEVRPWGSFTLILDSSGCKVKTLQVDPGKRLSYQSHMFRDERWIVVEGTAGIVLDGERSVMRRGEMIVVNRGQRHRIENVGVTQLLIVEVQLGEKLDEEDIVRYEDDFGRVAATASAPGPSSAASVEGER